MAGPMTANRRDVTFVQAAQVACQPANFCLLLLSALLYILWVRGQKHDKNCGLP